jgi:hypothetical protein
VHVDRLDAPSPALAFWRVWSVHTQGVGVVETSAWMLVRFF